MIYRMNLPGCFRILTILLILSEENGPIFPQRPSPGLRPPSRAPAREGHRSRNSFRVFCVFRGQWTVKTGHFDPPTRLSGSRSQPGLHISLVLRLLNG